MTTSLPTLMVHGWTTEMTAIVAETYVAQKVVGGTQYSLQDTSPRPATVNIYNLKPQSRIKISRVDTGAFLSQAQNTSGNSISIQVPYSGAVYVEARNASSTPAYKPWITQVTISNLSQTNVTALQEAD